MIYEKLLNEIYAVVSLKFLWKEYQPTFVKSESPDWINETMNLGLEVSQALLPEDGQTKNFIEQYLGCRKEELPPAAFERYGDRLNFYNGRFWAVLPNDTTHQDYLCTDPCKGNMPLKQRTGRAASREDETSLLDYKAKYRFDKKLEKLNTNYRQKRYNGLYLFLHPMEEDTINTKHLFEYMEQRQKECAQHFDWVFLNCRKIIYVCNFLDSTIDPIILPPNAENFLYTEAEYLRYCQEWQDGTSLDEAAALFGH